MLPADRILLQRMGTRIRELRAAAKLTQEELGEKAGFSGKYIGEIEKGLRNIPMTTLRAIAEAGLGVRPEIVLGNRASRAAESPTFTYAKDILLTAEIFSRLPLRARRPMLVLARQLLDNSRQ